MAKVKLERAERLRNICKRIIADPRSVDAGTVAAFKSAALRFVHTQYDDETEGLGALYRDNGELGSSLRKAIEVIDEAGGADIAKVDRGDTGHHNLAARVVEHMIDRLGHERRRHGFEKKESSQMESIEKLKATRVEKFEQLAKSAGVVAVAKHVLAEGTSGLTPADFNRMCNTDWQRDRRSGESYDQCFARHYSAPDAMDVRKADQMLKAMPFVADVTPVMVSGEDTRDLSDTSKAIEQLKALGARRWPTASAADQFERALTAPEHHVLARRAVPIPRATTSYPFPR